MIKKKYECSKTSLGHTLQQQFDAIMAFHCTLPVIDCCIKASDSKMAIKFINLMHGNTHILSENIVNCSFYFPILLFVYK